MYVTVTIARWNKGKAQIQWIHDQILVGSLMCHKTLESYRGFLVYLSWTYPSLVPHLKGIHLTLDSWRPHRDQDGWRLTPANQDQAMLNEHLQVPTDVPDQAPSHVTPVPLY